MALGGVLPQPDPESTEICVHGVPTDMECVHCLLAYCDFESQRLMEYARFLESFLEILLGEDWRNIAIEEVKRLPNLPLRITSHV